LQEVLTNELSRNNFNSLVETGDETSLQDLLEMLARTVNDSLKNQHSIAGGWYKLSVYKDRSQRSQFIPPALQEVIE